MIITATPAPASDVTIAVPELLLGSTQRVATARLRAGGKGVNVARVLRQQGFDTTAVVVAPPNGAFARDLAESDIPAVYVDGGRDVRTSFAIVETGPDRVTNLNERAPKLAGDTADRFLGAVREHAHVGSVLVFSGSLPTNFPTDALASLVRELRSRDVFVIVDSAPEALRAAAEGGANLLKPNEAELLETTGTAGIAGARELVDQGAEAVLLSRGAAGVVLVRSEGEPLVSARLNSPLRGNPTGAGDAAVAAVAARASRSPHPFAEEQIDELLRDVVSWSAAAVLEPLAGSLHESVSALRERVVIERPS